MKEVDPITVYYNSACPVCDAGIGAQRERMRACQVEWIDVHTDPDAAASIGAELEDVRERLHVRGADGQLHIGSEAMAELMAHTPRWRWAGWLTRRLDFLAQPAYNAFARWLYRRNRRRGRW